jgi:hypothetical protein
MLAILPDPPRANVTPAINIYVKMVTRDAEEAMKKLESNCPLAPQGRNRVSSTKSTIISPSLKPPATGYNGYRAPWARLAAAHNGDREK